MPVSSSASSVGRIKTGSSPGRRKRTPPPIQQKATGVAGRDGAASSSSMALSRRRGTSLDDAALASSGYMSGDLQAAFVSPVTWASDSHTVSTVAHPRKFPNFNALHAANCSSFCRPAAPPPTTPHTLCNSSRQQVKLWAQSHVSGRPQWHGGRGTAGPER